MSIKNRTGRPKGLVRRTHITSGASSKNLEDVLAFWTKHNPGRAAHVQEIIQKYLCHLRWDESHSRYIEVRDLAIRTVSRELLFMKILEDDYMRDVRDPITHKIIKQRPADQITRLLEIDDEITTRLINLGLYSTINR